MNVGLVWAAVVIYVLIATGVALLARGKGRSFAGMADYFIWNRSMGGVLAALSYAATTYSAFMLVGLELEAPITTPRADAGRAVRA